MSTPVRMTGWIIVAAIAVAMAGVWLKAPPPAPRQPSNDAWCPMVVVTAVAGIWFHVSTRGKKKEDQ